MKPLIITLVILLGLVFHLPTKAREKTAAQVDSTEKSRKIDAFMTALYQRGQFTGAVLVAERGRVIYKKAFGMADRDRKIPFLVATPGYIGSVSKPITAMGILILKEKGKIRYDDPIRQFFPQLPEFMNPVTIKHLLHHTSGLATFDDFPDMTEKDVLDILLKQEALKFAPGQQFEYCTAGYTLLGMIIQKVTGQSLHEFLTATIFKPLGMTSTSVNEIANRHQHRAIGYNLYGTPNNYDTFIGGSASVISTVEDLFKWDRALYAAKIINQATLAEAFTPSPISREDPVYGQVNYGFGWWIGQHNNGKNVFHNGSFGGFAAYMERFLAEENTIIFISNLRLQNTITDIRVGIANILDSKPYLLPKRSVGAWTYEQMQKTGIEAALRAFTKLKNSPVSKQYNFSESELNFLGYYLLRTNKLQEAIRIFTLNTEEYPQSANVFDSLGEAHRKAGNQELAIENYQKSLALDPKNENAKKMLAEILK